MVNFAVYDILLYPPSDLMPSTALQGAVILSDHRNGMITWHYKGGGGAIMEFKPSLRTLSSGGMP